MLSQTHAVEVKEQWLCCAVNVLTISSSHISPGGTPSLSEAHGNRAQRSSCHRTAQARCVYTPVHRNKRERLRASWKLKFHHDSICSVWFRQIYEKHFLNSIYYKFQNQITPLFYTVTFPCDAIFQHHTNFLMPAAKNVMTMSSHENLQKMSESSIIMIHYNITAESPPLEWHIFLS